MTSPLLMTMFAEVQDIYARLKTIARPDGPETMEFYVEALLSLSTEVIHPTINDVKPQSPGGAHIDPLLLSDIAPPTVVGSQSEDSKDDEVMVLEKSDTQDAGQGSQTNPSSIVSHSKPTISLSDHASKMDNSSFAIETQAEAISDTLLQVNTNNLQKRKFTSTIPDLKDKKNSKQKTSNSPPKLPCCSQHSTSNSISQDLIKDERASLSPPSKLKLQICFANQIKYGTRTPDELDFKENLICGGSLGPVVNDETHRNLIEDKSS
ncbi:uncharacterized protein MELLADRAFT_64279 [Melampsora larici-populina 98AG31]|uniref:Uncharacterized protein n=1 Tax=Melampsora larici-populina (strain 98AG31 / pathotype 3-4-7) TaxID=747676 RepID=F4RQV2_MELLP|nr:uncharacterized protein MELLADRAFT_64279 [Melampsora larici-populina 98AG31]EGG05106.1 hypothetical protein MELLADRAFT_64279 [Melampsora larici-populina 98AG31]